jgi:acyl carrier protein
MSQELAAGLFPRVARVIAKTQHIPEESITIDTTFEELKIDSLDGINILFAVEGEFDVDIPDDAARQIRSIREMVEGIEKLLAAKQAAAAKLAE